MNDKKYEINDLRSMLFKQMEKLDDPNCDLEKELKKADAMVNIGNTIIKSAATEVDFLRVTGGKGDGGTGFIPSKAVGNGKPKQIGNGQQQK